MKHVTHNIKHRTHTRKHKKTKKTVHGHNKKIMVASMVVIGAGLLFAAWFAWSSPWFSGNPSANWKSFTLPPRIFVPASVLPSGFPNELIADAGGAPDITMAQEIVLGANASSGTEYVVRWMSSRPMDALVVSFKDYFSTNGWVATEHVATSTVAVGFRATKDAATIILSVVEKPPGAYVRLNYIVK